MEKVIVVNNFINKNMIDKIINYMDNNLKGKNKIPLRSTMLFGYDLAFKDSSSDLKDFNFIREIFPDVKKCVASFYGDGDFEVSNLWLSKHLPGGKLMLHNDTDDQINLQFIYSTVLYLNTIDSGALNFPDIDYSYLPKAGDLVIFSSQDPLLSHEVLETKDYRYSMPMWLSESKYRL
jgi:hypothetical protein